MANAPGGKSVGRVTIRVIPDTSKFRDDLRKSLTRIEATESMAITVDKVNLDMTKVREDIRRQFAALDKVEVDAVASAIIDKVTVKRAEVRQSLQDQFDSMGLNVKVGVDLERAKKDVDGFVSHINRQQGTVNVNAATAAATAQMRWLARDRFVDFIPRISEAAFTKVATQLAALSGARVAYDWVDDILSAVSRLDKNLPTIGLLTSTITTLFSAVLASVSGVLGIGAGLASIVPTLLVLPGLILGTGFAITTFAVAMFDAKKQLAPLSGSMRELADIIQNTYWDAARQPIIDLITNLMPQLRTAFGEVAGSLGNFTGALAGAFDRQLVSGKLEALFAGISKSFNILSTGADAFAGALVSLSAVAAQYAPRLAQWFVDISIQFDTWLKTTSEDGRLTGWIDKGIAAIKDLGKAIVGISRQFYALWKAASAGGSGGLSGFADAMQHFADVMLQPKFQSTLTAIFRGVNDAMTSLGDGFVAVGNMLFALQGSLELFLGTSGAIVGQFMKDLAGAFGTPEVAKGLADFITGLQDGFKSFGEYMPDIAKGIADLGSFAGELGRQLGDVLGAALAGLSDVLGPFLTFVKDEIVPALGPTLVKAIEDLTPKVADLAKALEPLAKNLSEIAVVAVPQATVALEGFFDWLQRIPVGFWTLATDGDFWAAIFDQNALDRVVEKAKTGIYGMYGDILIQTDQFDQEFSKNWNDFWGSIGTFFVDWGTGFSQGWNDFWTGLASIPDLLDQWRVEAIAWMAASGVNLIVALQQGLEDSFPGITDFFKTVTENIQKFIENPRAFLFSIGFNIIQGLIDGIRSTDLGRVLTDIANTAVRTIKNALGIKSPSRVFRDEVGYQISAGLAEGIRSGYTQVDAALTHLVDIPSANTVPLGSLGAGSTSSSSSNSTVNYYAAPNVSLDSEQALFSAMRRAKVVAGW